MTRIVLAALAAAHAACGGTVRARTARIELVDVAAEAGIEVVNVSGDPRRWYIPESNGCGAAWLDYDGDGDVDLLVANGASMRYHENGARLEIVHEGSSRLYRNDSDEKGLRFADVTDAAGARRSDWINAIACGDADNDGDVDLYLACLGRDVYLRNEGGRFADATGEAGLGCELWGAGAAFGDADNDGDLDLYVANYVLFDPASPPDGGARAVVNGVEVAYGPEAENKRGFNPGAPDRFYRNQGGGIFVDATEEAGFTLEKDLCSYAVVFSDVNGDGLQDVLVANDMQPSNLFMNHGQGNRFVDEGHERGFALVAEGRATSAMGLFVADFEGDGDFDVFRTNFDMEPNCLHVNDGRGYFTDRAAALGLAEPSLDRLGWGGGFLDVENDGDLDLIVANGHVYPQATEIGMSPWEQQSQLFEAVSSPAGKLIYREATERSGTGLLPLRSARGVALGDPDDDGDLDALIVDMDHPPRLLENRSSPLGSWVAVKLVGELSNRDGYGARVSVRAAGREWVREARATSGLYSCDDPRLHFGLGEARKIEAIAVDWPSGARQTLEHPPINTLVELTEPRGTSESAE